MKDYTKIILLLFLQGQSIAKITEGFDTNEANIELIVRGALKNMDFDALQVLRNLAY